MAAGRIRAWFARRKDNPKPIKVYLQEGKDDLNNLHGNWPLGNQDLAAALQFAGYKYKLVMTDGGHSGKWGGEELPDALRWLWADECGIDQHRRSTKPSRSGNRIPMRSPSDDVPHGTVEQMPPWESKIFAEHDPRLVDLRSGSVQEANSRPR